MNVISKRATRYDVLDFYRFAGGVAVALVHYMWSYFPLAYSVKETASAQLQPLMGFFFTLSGFVIVHMYGGRIATVWDYADYMKKRLARMYPLHIVTFLVAPHFVGHYFPDAIIPNILLLHAWGVTKYLSFDYPSWSVSAEFFVYLLFPLFFGLTCYLGRLRFLLPFIVALAVEVGFRVSGHRDWNLASYDFGCLRAVPSFIAGMLVYQLATQQFAKLRVPVWIAHGVAMASLPLALLGVPSDLMLVSMPLVVFLLAKAEPDAPGVLSKPLPRLLANSSYGFYLLHALVAPVVFGRAINTLHLSDGYMYAVAPVAIAVTAALAMLSYSLFENPARKFLGNTDFSLELRRFRRLSTQSLTSVRRNS